MGINMQKYIGTCRPPWSPITMNVVQESIDLLKKRNLGVVALSAHDSCDESIKAFKNAFPLFIKRLRLAEE
jgi:hypothetical protein